ncbi:MAG: MogA/MoaB family molybdenum cofactor biosynthesis protein [Candidatus Eremiobacteraeota bacterium]|nr:MogA/MoaB family molybdenum cofactor biosynthesis protein [Candidatus Eremiobacteraeota bacterium]MBC5827204.1 MogA/MoaB family molybdenum cofactor biosynthesis protein [Candidatus Eremiobacteraeota bacterium]
MNAHPETRGQAWRFALVVVSDKAASGARADACMPQLRAALPQRSSISVERIVADDRVAIASLLAELADGGSVDCILTAGGTGLGPRDVTPQATLSVADYEVPGLAEAMRASTGQLVPTAMLSRAVAAVRARTLIVNLPGSPNAIRETLNVIVDVIPHGLGLLRGDVGEHAAPAVT